MITDITPYREHLDKFDLTEEEKYELVNAIWVISKNLLDKKFGINQPNPAFMSKRYQQRLPRNRTEENK